MNVSWLSPRYSHITVPRGTSQPTNTPSPAMPPSCDGLVGIAQLHNYYCHNAPSGAARVHTSESAATLAPGANTDLLKPTAQKSPVRTASHHQFGQRLTHPTFKSSSRYRVYPSPAFLPPLASARESAARPAPVCPSALAGTAAADELEGVGTAAAVAISSRGVHARRGNAELAINTRSWIPPVVAG